MTHNSDKKPTSIEPNTIPCHTLKSGVKIPAIGLGTFGSDHVSAQTIAETVEKAITFGYRHIDCASVYGNEKEIGKTIGNIISTGQVKREELWITSKAWNDMHDNIEISCKRSLVDLQLSYLDLYLIHWPFPNFHAPGCDVNSRNPNSKPYIHDNFMNTWRQMEKLQKDGMVKHIGTSNMTIPKLELLLRDCDIAPACNEMELHPHFQQTELFKFCIDNNIQPIGYCPIGSPGRPQRDRTADDTVDMEDPVIKTIAEKHNIHPATVCIKWAIQRGQIPIPFSVNNFESNLIASVSKPLSKNEMEQIAMIDKNCRLIKGQVFLWKDNQTWEDLWDLDGDIKQ